MHKAGLFEWGRLNKLADCVYFTAGLSHETFLANEGLREFFTVTSFSLDKAGSTYISSMESPKVAAVQRLLFLLILLSSLPLC